MVEYADRHRRQLVALQIAAEGTAHAEQGGWKKRRCHPRWKLDASWVCRNIVWSARRFTDVDGVLQARCTPILQLG